MAPAARLRQALSGAANVAGFADKEVNVAVTWGADANNPNYLVTNEVLVTDSFEGFWGELSDVDGPQYAVYFQDTADDIYYEVGSTSTVWTFFLSGAGRLRAAYTEPATAVETEVTWAGAAQLTAAAGAVAVALLF